MSTKTQTLKHFGKRSGESGNALIYVLIAIVLFAALSFTLSRQTDTSEASGISDEKAELYATQLITYAAQAKSAIDQMLFTTTRVNALDFTPPTDASFDTGATITKIYHPNGGGLTPGTIPADAIGGSGSDPVPGWYMGRFNNVEWTKSSANDVILVAYQIKQEVCERINLKITGSTTIPDMTNSIKNTMIDDAFHTGTNTDLTTDAPGDICPDCHNLASLCVHNVAEDAYGFYTVVADQ